MTAELKIVSMLLAGILSCQSFTASLPEPEIMETAAVTEAAEEESALAPMVLYEEWLPLSCTEVLPEEKMGQVLVDEVPGHKNFPHTFTVYLPPYYDVTRQYDLLIFLGPYNGRQGDCVDKYQSTWYTEIFRFRTVFDHLILENRVKPFIMVEPDYLQWKDLEINYDTIALSVKEELLPYVTEHYSTYAADSSYDSLVASRDHVIMGGCSLGGMHTFRGLMPRCMDVASSYVAMSCNINMNKTQEDILAQVEEYPMHKLVYTVGGIEEPRMKQMPDHLREVFPDFLNNENFTVLELEGTHHHYSTWAAGLWNSLQLILRDDAPPADQLVFTERQSDEEFLESRKNP